MSQLCTGHITQPASHHGMASSCPWRTASISYGPSYPDRCRSRQGCDTQQCHTAFLPCLSGSGHPAQATLPGRCSLSLREMVASTLQRTGNSAKHRPHGQDPVLNSRAFNPGLPGGRGNHGGRQAKASGGHHLVGQTAQAPSKEQANR